MSDAAKETAWAPAPVTARLVARWPGGDSTRVRRGHARGFRNGAIGSSATRGGADGVSFAGDPLLQRTAQVPRGQAHPYRAPREPPSHYLPAREPDSECERQGRARD